MKNQLFARKYWLAVIATVLFVSNALATDVTGTLVVENKSKGRSYNIMVKPDGSFATPDLAPGSYTFKCTLTAEDGTALPGGATIEYTIFNPKEIGLDHAAEKRVNKVEALVVKQKVAHSASATWSSIAIDEPGVHLTGKIMMKDAAGKTKVVWSPQSN
jgi:hypothetical protein